MADRLSKDKKGQRPPANAEPDMPVWFREEMWRKADAIAQRVRKATKILVRIEGKRLPKPVGGSVLIRVAESYFLLTARHVLDELADGPINVMSPPSFAPFNGRIHRTATPATGEDTDDAGILEIFDHSATDEMRQTALPLSILDRLPAQRHGQILQVVGYPASRFAKVRDRTVVPNWFQWTGTAHDEAELRQNGIQRPDRHVAFDFDPTAALNEKGELRRSTALDGVSGSGVWLLPPLGKDALDGEPGKLVGIFTDFLPPKKQRFMLSTFVGVHLGMILQVRPDLAPHILGRLPRTQ